MAKLKISNIIGKTIDEILPYNDGATIILSNGIELDVGIDSEGIIEPNHPDVVKKIFNLEDKLYDVTYVKEDKKNQANYKKQLAELKDSLVGRKFHYNKNPCTIKKVISTEEKNAVIIEIKTKEKTWINHKNNFSHESRITGIKKDKVTKKIYLYSLEK